MSVSKRVTLNGPVPIPVLAYSFSPPTRSMYAFGTIHEPHEESRFSIGGSGALVTIRAVSRSTTSIRSNASK